jgi:16S rRNA (cytosine967-C5)-methyltransferase
MIVIDYCAGGGGKTLGLAVQGIPAGSARAAPTPAEPEKVWTPTGWVEGPKPAKKAAGPVEAEGRLIACDIVQKRLDNIKPRLQRAGVTAELVHLGPNGGGVEDLVELADVVLVDAPCTGSGTWRRRPEDAWRLTPEEVARMHSLQAAIVARAAKLVKPGGRLVYATCSMLTTENEATVDAFEEDHPDFVPVAIAEAVGSPNFSDAGRNRLAELANGGHRLRLSPATAGTDGFFAAVYERQA